MEVARDRILHVWAFIFSLNNTTLMKLADFSQIIFADSCLVKLVIPILSQLISRGVKIILNTYLILPILWKNWSEIILSTNRLEILQFELCFIMIHVCLKVLAYIYCLYAHCTYVHTTKIERKHIPVFFCFARNFEIVVIECKVSKINISFLEKHISQNSKLVHVSKTCRL